MLPEDAKEYYKKLDEEAKKKFLTQEKPELSTEQIVAGQKLCFENAKSLIGEATFLHKNGYFARSFFLIMIAFEELAKIPMLLASLNTDQKAKKGWNKFWKRFRSHRHKLHGVELSHFFLKSFDDSRKGTNKTQKEWIDELATRPEWFEAMKSHSLYVDFINGQFISPSNRYFEEKCEEYLPIAEELLKFYETLASEVLGH